MGSLLYCPAAQAVHCVPLGFTVDPTGHGIQALVELELYWPAAHAVQDVPLSAWSASVVAPLTHRAHGVVERMLTRPAPHGVHVVAPTAARLPVIDPARQGAHADVDCALYSPATHAVQLTAPADANVSVVAPAAHAKHCDCPAWPWYCPATQSVHACVDAALERPAAQALHVVAPTLSNVSVTDPGAHAVHADVDTGLLDGKPTCRAVPLN